MAGSNFDAFKEKDKEAGVAVGKLVEIVEPESKADVELLGEVVQMSDPEYKQPDAFLVKRIFKHEGAEVALLVDEKHADVPEIEIQRFISGLITEKTSRAIASRLPDELAEMLRPRENEPKTNPLRKVMKGEQRGGVMFYMCATAFLRPKRLH